MRYDFVSASLAEDGVRAEACDDPFACPPDAPPRAQDKAHEEATNYAVESIPRYNEELEAVADDDDLFGNIVDDDPADPARSIPSGGKGGVDGNSRESSSAKYPPSWVHCERC